MEKLNNKQMQTVYLLYVIGIIYLQVDQLFVPKQFRLLALLLVFTIIFTILFSWLKPNKPFELSNKLALLLIIIVIPMYIIQDLIINKNFTFAPVIVTLSSLIFPYIIGAFVILNRLLRKVFTKE